MKRKASGTSDQEYRAEYCKSMVENLLEELSMQARIALTQQQAVYSCFAGGYQHRFSY